MKIGICLYGILYGHGGRTGSARDFRVCWPNIKEQLIDPFIQKGHEVKLYISSYEFTDKNIEKEFYDLLEPHAVYLTKFEGSDAFTSKINSFNTFMYEQLDTIVLTRSDVFWSRKIANENIDLKKFNFLFPENRYWQTNYRFTCDNLYIWPHDITPLVKKAMQDTYAWPRGKPFVDTHALIEKIENYLPKRMLHFISEIEERSDTNSFYTCYRNGLPKNEHIHPEVLKKYKEYNWDFDE